MLRVSQLGTIVTFAARLASSEAQESGKSSSTEWRKAGHCRRLLMIWYGVSTRRMCRLKRDISQVGHRLPMKMTNPRTVPSCHQHTKTSNTPNVSIGPPQIYHVSGTVPNAQTRSESALSQN